MQNLTPDKREEKYSEFIAMLQSDSFALLKAHNYKLRDKYKEDIVRFLRSNMETQELATKCRLAQQAADLIETIFSIVVEDIKKELNPNAKIDQKLVDQGGQVY